MKKSLASVAAGAALLFATSASQAVIEYVKVCSLYGVNFNYVPGTDICHDATTGDSRQVTESGVWRSLLPYPEGKWTTTPAQECLPGRIVTLGTFSTSDFSLNPWGRMQTQAVPVPVQRGEFVSKVIMSGGFSDPRLPRRQGSNALDGLCVRSVDPGVMENYGGGTINPPFGNGMLPVGCVANSRILNMPAAYAISATSAYPNVDVFYIDGGQNTVSGPYTYGSKLVVTTDFGPFRALNYFDARVGSSRPLKGQVSVSVCVLPGVDVPVKP